MQDATFLFTDIEGSTRLWEEDPGRMRVALARHDELARAAVEERHGRVVKMTGDGLHAAFDDACEAVDAAVGMMLALREAGATAGLPLKVRCGLHHGPAEGRAGDYYGTTVNRAARIMYAAQGGQVLASESAARAVMPRMQAPLGLVELGLVRLRDLSRPERLFQLVHPDLPGTFPPLRSLEGVPNNLPEQFSSFVGREREVAELRERVRQHRLVTVLGFGGLGKTRISLHVAAESLERFPDGAWFVELTGVHGSTDRVMHAIAAVLRVRPEPGVELEDALCAHVAARQLLLVLDNCEHVLEATAVCIRRLLQASAGLRIIATSREPLRLPGEGCYPLPGLAVPGPRSALAPAAVLQSESARLFVERARAASPAFQLDDGNAAAVAAICNRLDGMPLAIELAAARTRVLSPEEISTRLRDRFRILVGGDPSASPRQRTLRGLIDWSHDLLATEERILLRRLAVFAGGFSLDAVEAVCTGAGLERDTIVEHLASLVDKSLVVAQETGHRYHMLESVHHYAAGKLVEAHEEAAFRERHFQHHAALAAASKTHMAGPAQAEWAVRIDRELGNLLAAHDWAGKAGTLGAEDIRLAGALKLYWVHRGLLELGAQVVREAVEQDAGRAPRLARAQGLFNLGQLHYFMGKYRIAREWLQQSLALAREEQDAHGVATVLQPLGMAALGDGDAEAAGAYLREAVALAETDPAKRALPGALNALAQWHRSRKAPLDAEPLYGRVQALAREVQDRDTEGIALLNLAMVDVEAGTGERAPRRIIEALRIAQLTGSKHLAQSALDVAAAALADRGTWLEAACLLGTVEARTRETGLRRDPVDQAFIAPRIETVRRALGRGAFERALVEGRQRPDPEALEIARAALEAAVAAREAVTSR